MKTTAQSLSSGAKRIWSLLGLMTALALPLTAPLPARADAVNLSTGASSYTLPIAIPSGTNGVAPSLALVYGNGEGNGWLGVGWTLTGLGTIERLGPTYSPSPTYTATDTYRLNLGGSEKLVYTGVDPSGTTGSYFRTQNESFQRIEYVAASNSWLVTDKGGVKYFFGQSDASRQNNPGNAAQVFSWKLDKVQDSRGVFWTVSYDKDTVNGDMYPKQIVYSQGAGLACTPTNLTACRTVDFTLRPRVADNLPSSYPRDGMDTPHSYRTGARISTDKLLQQIDVKLGGQLVRAYVMYRYSFEGNSPDGAVGSYYTDGIGPRLTTRTTQLVQVDELDAQGYYVRPPHQFTYHRNPYDSINYAGSTTFTQAAVTGDPVEGVGGTPQNPPTASNCTYTMDMNNDARSDVLVGQAGNWSYYPSVGNGSFGARVSIPNPATTLPSLCTATSEWQRYYTGETTTEMFYGSRWMARSHLAGSLSWRFLGWNSCRGSCTNEYTDAEGWWIITKPVSATREIVTPVRDTTVMDMDGDGLPDILSSTGVGQWYWWKGLAGAQFANRAVLNAGAAAPAIQLSDKDVRLVDMDSDGLPDLVKMVLVAGTCAHAPSTWRVDVYRNQGRDASGVLRFSAAVIPSSNLAIHVDDPDAAPVACTTGVPPMPSNGFAFVDVNNDGLADLTWFVRGLTSTVYPLGVRRVYYYPNQGAPGGAAWSFAPKVAVGGDLQMAYAIMTQVDRWVDMNSDGMMDLLAGISPSVAGGGYFYHPLVYSHVYANSSFPGRVILQNPPAVDLTRNNFMTLTDINGDGTPGILQGSPGNYVHYSLNHSSNHHYLETAVNPQGGTTAFAYKKLLSGNTIRWVANQVSANDGVGGVVTKKYSFYNGLHVGWPHNEFRGYATAMVTDPAGHYEVTNFHQDDAKKGHINTSAKYRSPAEGAALMSQTSLFYTTTTPVAGVSRVDLAAQQTAIYDGGSSAKFVQTNYANYDAYGNARQTTFSGTGITARVTNTDFVYNATAYLVEKPSHTWTTVNSVKTAETWFAYDGLANGVAPTLGNLTRETRWLSGGASPIVQYFYDSTGNRIGVRDPKVNTCAGTGYSNATVFDTTFKTYPVTETNALCQVTSKTYWGVNTTLDAAAAFAYPFPGLIATVTDVNGVRTDSYWESLGRPYKLVVPPDTADLPTRDWNYSDLSGVPMRITEYSQGGPTTYTYVDGFGRAIQVKRSAETSGDRTTQDIWYNSRGLIEAFTLPYLTPTRSYTPRDAAKPKTSALYDAVRRPVRVTNPDNTYRTFAYTPFVVAETDEKFYTTTRSYDALARLLSVVEPTGGGAMSFNHDTFDSAGNNIRSVTNANANSLVTTFDTLGRKKSHSDPDLGIWNYTYDANGNLLTQQDAKLQTIRFGYDKLNRIATKTYPDSKVITYSYDDATAGTYRRGRLWQVGDLAAPYRTVYTYDQRGRQTQVTKTLGLFGSTTRYGYDSLDRVTSMTYPNNEVVGYTYNGQGLLDSVTHATGTYATFDYNALGQPVTKTAGNGKVTTYDYYPDSQRLRTLATPGVQNLTYSYDNAGNIGGIASTVQAVANQTFGYDALHRLTAASSPTVGTTVPGYSHTYTYDAIGNLRTGDGKTFTYPAAGAPRPHAASSYGTCSLGYDANGNLATRTCGTAPVRTYTWDYDNRLTQIKDGTTVVASFSYDHAGQRWLKMEGSTTTTTFFPHYRTVNGQATKYYLANGQRIAERDNTGAVFYYHPDHLGSTSSVTNSTGTEVYAEIAYPYGRDRAGGGSKTVVHRYTGQERDTTTGLYYYGARYYDPVAMRFISADSIIPNMADPQTFNHYAYTRGNPVKYVDPSGHDFIDSIDNWSYRWNGMALNLTIPLPRSSFAVFAMSGDGAYAGIGLAPRPRFSLSLQPDVIAGDNPPPPGFYIRGSMSAGIPGSRVAYNSAVYYNPQDGVTYTNGGGPALSTAPNGPWFPEAKVAGGSASFSAGVYQQWNGWLESLSFVGPSSVFNAVWVQSGGSAGGFTPSSGTTLDGSGYPSYFGSSPDTSINLGYDLSGGGSGSYRFDSHSNSNDSADYDWGDYDWDY